MKNGYQDHFKKLRSQKEPVADNFLQQVHKASLRAKTKAKRKKNKFFAVTSLLIIVCMGAGSIFLISDKNIDLLLDGKFPKLKFNWTTRAAAEDKPAAEKPGNDAPARPGKEVAVAEEKTIEEAPAHLGLLVERKKELDVREQELNRRDLEIARVQKELEEKLKELEQQRRQIASILQERITVDTQRVETLVQVYSNMKPQMAAKVFETMDTDLAVEILKGMKKKNAAEIMNLLKAERAQSLSEKFAGYQKRGG